MYQKLIGIALLASGGLSPVADRSRANAEIRSPSIKLVVQPYPSGAEPWILDHGRFRAMASARVLIGVAYGLMRPTLVVGGPAWLDEPHQFETMAENPDAGPTHIYQMMRTLLADRFKLVTHPDTTEMQEYVLIVEKGGSKMQEAKA